MLSRPRAGVLLASGDRKVDYAGTPRTAAEVRAMSLANLQGEYARVVSTAKALRML
jgi:hypothetical protein